MSYALRALREEDLDQKALNETVYSLASHIVSDPRFSDIDFNLLVALIYLQTGHPELNNYVRSFLRGEELSDWQRRRLGGIVPKANPEDSLCNKSAKGGALKRELQALEETASRRRMVLVRTTEFPSDPKTKIAQQIGTLITQGARRVVIGDSDWRAMMAFEAFKPTQKDHRFLCVLQRSFVTTCFADIASPNDSRHVILPCRLTCAHGVEVS